MSQQPFPGFEGVVQSSESVEWGTPVWLFDVLNREFGFGTDVCATAELAKCDHFYSPEQDGLAQPWGGVCWMNPPYGDVIKDWVAKADYESLAPDTEVVGLVPARTDTNWFWDYCVPNEVRFLKGRLRFGDGRGTAPFPSAVVVFNRSGKTIWWRPTLYAEAMAA